MYIYVHTYLYIRMRICVYIYIGALETLPSIDEQPVYELEIPCSEPSSGGPLGKALPNVFQLGG